MTPTLTVADGIVERLIAQDITDGQALAQLRARRMNPDPVALALAVAAGVDRDGLRGGLIDPMWWLQAAPRPGLDAQAYAVELAEMAYDDCLRVLTRQMAVAS